MVFLSVGNNSIEERLVFSYWGVILALLKLGIPYDVILGFSPQEINIILGYEQALVQKERDERDRQQRIANNV